jgi:hypothetical protein
VDECLTNFLDSDRLAWLAREAGGQRDEWIIDPPGYGETRLGDLKLYCKVDFLFPIGDRIHILDWKTGKSDPDKHRKQLIGYASWASFHFETPAEHILPTIAYLYPAYHEVEETFNEFDLENFAVQVQAETDEMYDYCRDFQQNIPRNKSEFPLIEDRRICRHCNFRGICFPEEFPAQF